MASQSQMMRFNPSPEAYDFTFARIKELATTKYFNPISENTEQCIDQSKLYEGLSYNLDPILGQSEHLRYSILKKALERPGLADEACVPAPMRNGTILLSDPEIFDVLCKCLPYPYYKLDINILIHYKRLLAHWIDNCNLYEPCGGFGEKIKLILSHSREFGCSPKRLIINDTEDTNLSYAVSSIRESLTNHMLAESLKPEIKGIHGDWLDNATYILKKNTPTGGRSGSQENLLETLKQDPATTTVFLPGAMANDFTAETLHPFLHDNFKRGTLYLIGYDSTLSLKSLAHYYKGDPKIGDQPLVQQLALSGITHACWKNIDALVMKGKVRHITADYLDQRPDDQFDPRLMGVSVDPVRWNEDEVNIQISVFTKDRPDRRVLVHPIVKTNRPVYMKMLKEAGFEMVGVLHPRSQINSDVPADYAMLAFTHRGHERGYQNLFNQYMPQAA